MVLIRILILGASGFIGNTLYRELQSYYDVYGTYCSQEGLFENNQVFYKYNVAEDDISEILEAIRPTIIVSALRGDFQAQFKAHEILCEYSIATNAKLLYLSTVNVFDAKREFPSYENDVPLAESDYGKFKISVEKRIQQLPKENYAILRLPMVLGVNAPRLFQLKQAIKHQAAFEVFPNLIISLTTSDKIAQQVHYIINKEMFGIFHLSTKDVVHHEDLFKEISEKISDKTPIFKSVFESNEDRYLAILPKKNKLPKNYRITVAEVIKDSTLNEEIITLKS
ncbi:MAG: sugar nucleotide-binding protein [Flavobacteriaceae bacterium]|nr:sugar nucleotide-binding protein [Flavobacteriaceae bacterium]